MSSREIARQWFIPDDGIDRTVISADIQRYLGNDATVRPGMGTGENEGVKGFWIKAYRNLTSAMIADLRADSVRWRQEQRATGTRGSPSPVESTQSGITVPDSYVESYVGSSTYNASSAARTTATRGGDSPHSREYGVAGARDRGPPARMPENMDMDMDPPMQSARPYPQDRPYPPAGPGFAPGNPTRGPNFPGNEYPPEQTPYSRAPAPNPAYGGGPGYQQPPLHNNDSAPPGYVRQGNYYVPMPSYETGSSMPSRSEPPNPYGPGYGQPPPNPRNEPRGYGQPDYPNDASRFAYPSPATTVSSVTTRDREPVTIAQQPSGFTSPMGGPSYDQYGRPVAKHPTGGPRQPESFVQTTREPSASFGRGGSTAPSSSGGDQRRRRLN